MIILLIASLIAPDASHAAGAFKKKVKATFCAPVAEIDARVQDCEGNDEFLDAGEKCLDKLDAEEKSVAAFLPKGFSANHDPEQAAKFASAVQDYQATSAALTYLIATTKVAEGEIQAYKFSLELPPDIDEKEVTGGDELAYAMSVDCYGTNRENLESLLEDFQTRRARFEAIKAAADANAAAAGLDRSNLEVSPSSGLKQVKGKGKGQGEGVKGQVPRNGQSDITGTQEDAEKRKK